MNQISKTLAILHVYDENIKFGGEVIGFLSCRCAGLSELQRGEVVCESVSMMRGVGFFFWVGLQT